MGLPGIVELVSQRQLIEYRCDVCVERVHQDKPPAGWHALKLNGDARIIYDGVDLCPACTDAVIRILNKRKQIGKGRLTEAEPVVHNLPSPENADALVLLRSRVGRAPPPGVCEE